MKINFKKVTSVLATTFMLGSTVAFASAAYPAPFVNNGAADAAIVYGAAAPATGGDMAQATDLGASLEKSVTTVSTSAPTGEAKAIETSGQKLYVGDYMNTTKEAFTKNELPTILADGKISDADGTSFDYNQKILNPNTIVKYGKTSDNLATPILYMDLETGTPYYTAQVIFPTAINVTKMTDKEITLFGKKFTFSGSAADLTSTKVVLFENANSKIVTSGETVSVNVGGTAYTIQVNSVEDQSNALISVNGVSQKVVEGSSYKVSGLDLYAKNVIGPNVAGENRGVELYLGSSKMTLENGNEVLKGTENVDGSTVTIESPGVNKISKISVKVEPTSLDNEIKYLKIGDSMTDPVFGAFKISFNTVTPDLEASSKDMIVVKSTGEAKASLKWTNRVGGAYEMDMFKPSNVQLNASKSFNATGSVSYNATMLGYDTYDIIATTTGQVNKNDYVITRNNEYSQIFKVEKIDIGDKLVRLQDMASGSSSQDISLNASHEGSVASLSLADGSSCTVTLTGNGTAANVTFSKASPLLYTKSGALITLTNIADAGATLNQSTVVGQIQVTEETSYNDGDFKNNVATTLGTVSTNISLLSNVAGKTGNDIYVDAVTVADSYSGSVGDYDVYYLTKYGTFVKKTGNDDKTVTMYYPGTAASLGVYVSELSSGSGSTGAIPVVSDDKVSSVKDKNLIVVGGSCINTVAASLLGSSSPLCGSAFTAASGAGPNQYLIKVFNSPYATSGKVAMLVAGYEAAETAAAVAKVKEGTVDTSVSMTPIIGPTTV